MRAQSKRSGLNDRIFQPGEERGEIYRKLCQDEDGNPYTVIVYRPFPHLSITDYALADGTPVRFVDDCLFEVESTGRTLTRRP